MSSGATGPARPPGLASSDRPAVELVTTGGDCPSLDELATALAQFLPGRPIRSARTGTGAILVEVTDLVSRYRVAVAGQERLFADEARRCEDRAQTAAVFVALILEPPSAGDEPAPPAPALAVVAPSPPPRHRLFVDVEATGALRFSPPPGPGDTLLAGGASLRVSAGWRSLGLALGVSALTPSRISVDGGGAARLQRVPVDLDLRLLLRWRRVELLLDGGLQLTAAGVRGEEVPGGTGTTVLDVGWRAALGVRVRGSARVWPLLALEASVVPGGTLLLIDAQVVGATPRWWLGLDAGVAWKAW